METTSEHAALARNSIPDTVAHLRALTRKRDKIAESITDTKAVLVAQLARAEFTPREVPSVYARLKSMGEPGLCGPFLSAIGISHFTLRYWSRIADVMAPITAPFPVPADHDIPPRGTPVVYILMAGSTCLYVGKTVNPRHRLTTHHKDRRILADHVQIIPCTSEGAALDLEGDLIYQHRPPYNRAGVKTRRGAA